MDQPVLPPESPASPDRTREEATPTSVRQGLEPARQDRLRDVEVPSRVFQGGEEEWAVRESGWTTSGRGSDTRVPMVLLLFARGAEPDQPIQEILIPGRGLDELTDQELSVLLGRARPYRTDQGRKEVFPDTRKKEEKGL
jgi:hypothetical protein